MLRSVGNKRRFTCFVLRSICTIFAEKRLHLGIMPQINLLLCVEFAPSVDKY